MQNCPSYRLRLFLSVDLVGSTAYKARFGEIDKKTQQPHWVDKLKRFYIDFPELLKSNFERVSAGQKSTLDDSCKAPVVWKTVGDEILFCCRLISIQHLAVSAKSFLDALEEYGKLLESDTDGNLDVKGSGWVAAFPAPNVTVNIPGRVVTHTEGEEEFEIAADTRPSDFDFLGKNIDAGFRTSRNAAANHFAASVELAYLLSRDFRSASITFEFMYHGRQIFKGVIGDKPYPVTTVYAERNSHSRTVKEKEESLTGSKNANVSALNSFLEAFMIEQKIEMPVLPNSKDDTVNYPPTYLAFCSAWQDILKEQNQRDALLEEAEEKSDGPEFLTPEEIDRIIRGLEQKDR